MIMTEGGPNGATQVMVERIYTYGFKYFKMGYASAYSWLLFVIIFALTGVQMKLQKGKHREICCMQDERKERQDGFHLVEK